MKVVRTAAMVVGAIALVATGVGALVGGAAFVAATGVSLATVSAIGAVAGAVSQLTAKRPKQSVSGSPTEVRTDVQAPVPMIVGRTFNGGNVVHQDTFGKDGKWLSRIIVYSLGPIQEIEAFKVDRTTVTFTANNAVGFYSGFMARTQQLGALPEAAALSVPSGPMPSWGSANKLSGLAAMAITFTFDTKGKKYAGGLPQTGIVAKGVKVYDPRLDSTYPGGVGAHRALDEATYAYSENPWLHALTFALGRWHNGQRAFGVGMPIAAIDLPAFVEAANVADANGWKAGGMAYSTDDKWNLLKALAQAGGGEPIRLGAKLSCIVDTPRVSLATITSKDLIGEGSVVATQPRRDRINSIIPRVRLETHGWEIVPLDAVRPATYVTEDGDWRTREFEYPFIQDKNQGAVRAAYDIANAREFGPISLPLKTIWMGYKPGDCLTISVPELGLNSQKTILLNRSLNPETLQVNHDFRSETEAKHAFALGQIGTAPPTPSLTPPDLSTVPSPEAGSWTLTGTTHSTASGSVPALLVQGAVDNGNADSVVFEVKANAAADSEYRVAGIGPPETIKRMIAEGVAPGAQYQVAVSYIVRGVTGARLVLGPATAGSLTAGETILINGATAASVSDGAARAVAGLGGTGDVARPIPATIRTSSNILSRTGGGTYIGELDATLGDNLFLDGALLNPVSPWIVSGGSRQAAVAGESVAWWFEKTAGATNVNASSGLRTIPVVGDKLFLSFLGKGLVGHVFQIVVDFYDASGANMAGTQYNSSLTLTAAGQGRIAREVPRPTGAASFLFNAYGYENFVVGNIKIGDFRMAGTETAADVTAGAQVALDIPPLQAFDADYQGTIAAGVLPATTSPKVSRGGVSIKSAADVTYQLNSVGCTSTLSTAGTSKGDFTTNSIAGTDATQELIVFVGGVERARIKRAVQKRNAAPPSTGATGAKSQSTSTFNQVNSISYVALSTVMRVTLATGERLVGTAPLSFGIDGSTATTRSATCKWRHITAPGTPNSDFGTGVGSSSTASSGYFTGGTESEWVEPVPGSGNFNEAVPGLAAGDYDVQLFALLSDTGRTATFTGTATIEAKV